MKMRAIDVFRFYGVKLSYFKGSKKLFILLEMELNEKNNKINPFWLTMGLLHGPKIASVFKINGNISIGLL